MVGFEQQQQQMQYEQQQQQQEQQLVRQSDDRVTRWDNLKVTGQATLSHEHDAGYFTAHNVEGGIHVRSPNLDFRVLKNKNVAGQYRIKYIPDGEEHVVDVRDKQMKSILGSPFKIAPHAATLEHDTQNGRVVLSNIYNDNDVDIQTDSCPFKMDRIGNNKYAISLFPHYNGGEHTISVSHKGKVMQGGNFKMLPNPNRQQQRMIQMAPPQPRMIQMAPYPQMPMPMPGQPQQMMQIPMQPMPMQGQPQQMMQPPQMVPTQHGMMPMYPQMMQPPQVGQAIPVQGSQPPMFTAPY